MPNDEPANPPDDTIDEELEYCAHCGTKLPDDEWCPVVTDTDADGNLVVRSFCDDACKDAWTDDAGSTLTD